MGTFEGRKAVRDLSSDQLTALAEANAFALARGAGSGIAQEAWNIVAEAASKGVNPLWVTGEAIEEAYRRGLIDAEETDRLRDKAGL